MLSLLKCSKILNEKGRVYNEEEVKIIRDFIYKLGELGYEVFNARSVETAESKSTSSPST